MNEKVKKKTCLIPALLKYRYKCVTQSRCVLYEILTLIF